jgi:hypothetical protein
MLSPSVAVLFPDEAVPAWVLFEDEPDAGPSEPVLLFPDEEAPPSVAPLAFNPVCASPFNEAFPLSPEVTFSPDETFAPSWAVMSPLDAPLAFAPEVASPPKEEFALSSEDMLSPEEVFVIYPAATS